MTDYVNHPPHYATGKYESIDVMVETQGAEAVKNFCICNAFKYIYRHKNKNGLEYKESHMVFGEVCRVGRVLWTEK